MNGFFQGHLALRHHLLFIVALCLCVYFSYHALQGQRGIFRYFSLNIQIEKVQAEHLSILEKRKKLESNVFMMRSESLNLDLLEERAKYVLGYKEHQEHMIMP